MVLSSVAGSSVHLWERAMTMVMMRVVKIVVVGLALCVIGVGPAMATTLGVAMAKSGDPFVDTLRDALKEAASTHNGVMTEEAIADNSGEKQIGQIRQFVQSGVDALIVHPAESSVPEQAARIAAEANIPLVFVNRKPPQAWFKGRVSISVSNDLVAGRLQMRKLIQLMHEKGNVGVLVGNPPAGDGRTQGVHEVAAKYPEVKIVREEKAAWNRQKARGIVSEWIKQGVVLNAIAANNDEMAIGAIEALHEAGLSTDDILVAGVDATRAALAEMGKGTLAFTVRQDAKLQGAQAVNDALRMIDNKPVPLFHWVPYSLITPQVLAKEGS